MVIRIMITYNLIGGYHNSRGINCLYFQGTEAVHSSRALGTNCETVCFDTEDSNLHECPPLHIFICTLV
jgi:hypothetical protein